MLRILVIGMNRCGTKYLSNLLAAQPTIAAVQSEQHTGILETNAFSAFATKFPHIQIQEEYIGLVELWVKTDFLSIAKVDRKFLYALSPRPLSSGSMFRMIMDDYAARQGCDAWLQKVSPQASEIALKDIPDSMTVVVERNFWDAIKSMHYLGTQGQKAVSLHLIASVEWQRRVLRQLKRKKAITVQFEQLIQVPDRTVQLLCEQFGIKYSQQEMPQWKMNSSFKNSDQSCFEFSFFEKLKITVISCLLLLVPTAVLKRLASIFGQSVEPAVPGSFSKLPDIDYSS